MVDTTGPRNGENDPMKAITRDEIDCGAARIDTDPGGIDADAGGIGMAAGSMSFAASTAGDPPVAEVVAARPRFDLSHRPLLTRAQQIAQTLDSAMRDAAFHDHVTRADAARDCGDWPLAEQEYGMALRRFPLH